MQYNKSINVSVGRCNAELEVEFDLTPGWRGDYYTPGYGPELDGFSLGILALRFESGTEVDYSWLESRGFVGFAEASLDKAISNTDVEDALGNLSDYIDEYDGD